MYARRSHRGTLFFSCDGGGRGASAFSIDFGGGQV